MREIKFRAWDKETKEMLTWKELLYADWSAIHSILTEEPFIPLQYTGLKDKNGKEIYEGDVLNCKNHWGNTEIVWFNAGFRGKFIDHNDKICYAMIAWVPSEGIEIIGNIYANPELLETKP